MGARLVCGLQNKTSMRYLMYATVSCMVLAACGKESCQSTELIFSKQSLQSLPSGIGDCAMVQIIYADANQLTSVPSSIGKVQALRELDLSYNQLNALPDELADLANLEQLDLSNNQFKELPPAVLKLSKLRILDLRNNQVSALPADIANLQSLENVYLSGNAFTTEQRAEFRRWLPSTKFVWSVASQQAPE